jgi:TolB-like protein/DNA-binding winged helix-turn-helix (wHTH) protein/Flp pilus assembly protein TadD
MSLRESYFYEFGPFRLLPGERRLLRNDQPVPLPPKAFDTLQVLVENSGHLLDKETLLQRVWADTFVEEGNLAQNVFLLRRALGQSENGAEFIETIPKSGYRFVAPVRVVGQERPVPVAASVAAPAPFAGRSGGWAAGVTLAVLLLSAAYFVWRGTRPLDSGTPAHFSIAVLPFENLTGEADQDYLIDGFTEEMITQLSLINPDRLGVIARTSAMQYKQTKKGTAEIGRELGVDYLLEGSVRREGDRVRISAQLIQVRDQTHLWAQNYERDLRDVLALQSEVAQVIARQIEIKLTPRQQARLNIPRTVDPEAYELYLRARFFWNKRDPDDMHKAVSYFQRAIAKDGNFAQAYSGLADAYSVYGYSPDLTSAETRSKATAAAKKAVELDAGLAEAQTSLAFVTDWNRNPVEAEARFKHAIELNPNYATAHHWYSLFLKDTGRKEEAIPEIMRARELDPLSVVINSDVGLVLYFARHYDQAIQESRKALEMDPNFRWTHWVLGMAYEQKKSYELAVAEYQRAEKLFPGTPLMLAYLARGYVLAGKKSEGRTILNKLEKRPGLDPAYLDFLGLVYDALGETDKTFACLEKAYRSGEPTLLVDLRNDPRFDHLRPDPRFQALLRRASHTP